MRRAAFALTTALVIAFGTSPRAADNLVLSRFSDYLDSLRAQAGIPGLAATIVGTTETVWERGFGLQDVERSIAARPDTPFAVDGLMQIVDASLALRCDESRWLSIDDPSAKYLPGSPDAGATLRMLMTHTSPGANGLVFAYRMDRLAAMAPAISACTDSTYRSGIAGLFRRMAMIESVPGADVVSLEPGDEGFDAPTLDRYAALLARQAVPYAVDGKGRAAASPSTVPATLTPAGGLITSARDLARFDLALKNGAVVQTATLAAAWTAPIGGSGLPLPHGVGWFVQSYNGEPIVWQFGESATSSSMMITAPRRGITLILLANSSGLVRSLNLAAGDITVSPFARVFLGLFVR
ncbi:MAG TPA: serine hydrolase domain-containing protein [Vicinamibacterales bacterium]|nr:serine hydrolase domain-containing protein [Vicinamibacterales bacterium]